MKKTGFSLVEMMVAVSIFAVVALIATNAFLTADRINKKAQAMKTIIDNLHFALSNISFDLQQGGTYHCISDGEVVDFDPLYSQDCTDGGTAIAFRSPKSGADGEVKTIIYKLNQNRIYYQSWDPLSEPKPDPVPITVDNLVIDNLKFYVSNSGGGGNSSGAPRVFFTISGVAQLGSDDLATPFQLQTVVSERL